MSGAKTQYETGSDRFGSKLLERNLYAARRLAGYAAKQRNPGQKRPFIWGWQEMSELPFSSEQYCPESLFLSTL
jgi:hypothetical protein